MKAGREVVDGRFAEAAETFDEIGSVPYEAEARLRAGRARMKSPAKGHNLATVGGSHKMPCV